MANSVRIGITQLCSRNDVAQNLQTVENLVTEAVNQGAEAVFLPEAFAYIGSDEGQIPLAETFADPGPIISSCVNLARTHGVHLIAGGFPERAPHEKIYNTCFHVTPPGDIHARYRKIHLFDVDLADGTKLQESRTTAPGKQVITTELPFGTLGMSVCYDLRFPRLYQSLVDVGAVAVTVPAAFTAYTGQAHWHVLLRARAIECQAYFIAPAQVGDHRYPGRQSFGHALVVDPWGTIVAECSTEEPSVAVADIDPSEVTRVRSQLPSLKHRREFQ
ncbi:MAG: carbon-nitrogen hydrolase family protein [Gammaproteobacteria bacterium]|nr:carbon-nitrogen hydrolase family protein [Gammaproteobacteria bacterium]